MIVIRPGGAADGPAVARIRATSWGAAYEGIIPAATLARLTAPDAVEREGEWRAAHPMEGCLMAEAAAARSGQPAAPVGFVHFGPERAGDNNSGWNQDPPDRAHAEVYAIYVLPGHWSTGAGRALMDRALQLAADAGYHDISLWVLEANRRARRFYERAGFQPTGESMALGELGGVTEIRYRRLVS